MHQENQHYNTRVVKKKIIYYVLAFLLLIGLPAGFGLSSQEPGAALVGFTLGFIPGLIFLFFGIVAHALDDPRPVLEFWRRYRRKHPLAFYFEVVSYLLLLLVFLLRGDFFFLLIVLTPVFVLGGINVLTKNRIRVRRSFALLLVVVGILIVAIAFLIPYLTPLSGPPDVILLALLGAVPLVIGLTEFFLGERSPQGQDIQDDTLLENKTKTEEISRSPFLKHISLFTVSIVFIGGILVFAIGRLLFYYRQTPPLPISPHTLERSTTAPSLKQVDAQRWIQATFPENYKHSVEIWYPEEWFFSCCGDKETESHHLIFPSQKPDRFTQPHILITDYALVGCPSSNPSCGLDDLVSLTPHQWFESIKNSLEQTRSSSEGDQNLTKNKELSLPNLKAQAVVYQGQGIGSVRSVPVEMYIVEMPDGVIAVRFYDFNKFGRAFINEFLQRLELASWEKRQPSTSDWKLYRNEKTGFEFSYPSILQLTENFQENFWKSNPLRHFLEVKLQSEYLNGSIFINDAGRGFEGFNIPVSREKIVLDGVSFVFQVLEENPQFSNPAELLRGAIVSFDHKGDQYFFIFTYKKQGLDQAELVKSILSTVRLKK